MDQVGAAVTLADRIVRRANVEDGNSVRGAGVGQLQHVRGWTIGYDQPDSPADQRVECRSRILLRADFNRIQCEVLTKETTGGVVVGDANLGA